MFERRAESPNIRNDMEGPGEGNNRPRTQKEQVRWKIWEADKKMELDAYNQRKVKK